MSLRPKTKRLLWVCAAVFVIVLALGAFFAWTKFFREEKEVFANEEEHFKYGSLGAEGDRGIPYYLWMILQRKACCVFCSKQHTILASIRT